MDLFCYYYLSEKEAKHVEDLFWHFFLWKTYLKYRGKVGKE